MGATLLELLLNIGSTSVLLAILAYVFRETWKQWLVKAVGRDLERYKADLQKEAAEHAASLAPQLEAIKAEFQQKVEAYKVSLIAQAEHAKAESDLHKEIAIRHSLLEYERLVALEKCVVALTAVVSRGKFGEAYRTSDDVHKSIVDLDAFASATDAAAMFLERELWTRLVQHRIALVGYAQAHVGPGLPVADNAISEQALRSCADIEDRLRPLIHRLGRLGQPRDPHQPPEDRR